MTFRPPIHAAIYGSSVPVGTSRKKTAAPTFKSKPSSSAARYRSLSRGLSTPSFAVFQKLFSRTCSAPRKKPSPKNPPRPQTNPFHKSFHHGRHLFCSVRSMTLWHPLRGLSSVRQRLQPREVVKIDHRNPVIVWRNYSQPCSAICSSICRASKLPFFEAATSKTRAWSQFFSTPSPRRYKPASVTSAGSCMFVETTEFTIKETARGTQKQGSSRRQCVASSRACDY